MNTRQSFSFLLFVYLFITASTILQAQEIPIPDATVGVPYTYGPLNGGANPAGTTWFFITTGNATSPPSGLTIFTDPVTRAVYLKGTLSRSGQFFGFGVEGDTTVVTGPNTTSTSVAFTGLFDLNVVLPPPLAITTAALPAGTIGAAYTGGILTATGGIPPYLWSMTAGSSLPDGLILNSGGTITGTPTTAGTTAFSATVNDSATNSVSRALNIVINPPGLRTTVTALPGGAVGATYTGGLLTATGGRMPYVWSVVTGSLPGGLTLDPSSGAITGTPTTAGTSPLTVQVTDFANASARTNLSITITAVSLTITTTALPAGNAGMPYSQTLTASGGTPPYVWSLAAGTTLPAGLVLNPTGSITGTPTATGASFTVQVRDSANAPATASANLSITIVSLSVTIGPSGPFAPAQQPVASVTLANPAPQAISGTLTLTFVSSVGGDDQMIRFSNGVKTAAFTIAAGSTQGNFGAGGISVLTGTVAGTITLTAALTSGGLDVTPKPVPTTTITISPGIPIVTKVTIISTPGGFTVSATGYSTSRNMDHALFHFAPAPNVPLTQPDVTVAVNNAFTAWYANSTSEVYGSEFTFKESFTYSGNILPVAGLTLEMINSLGTSGRSMPVSP